jgi:hypothetical protein
MQGGTKHGPSFGNALPQGLIQHKASSYIYIVRILKIKIKNSIALQRKYYAL